MESTIGMAAELRRPTKFAVERKFGLKPLTSTHSASNTATGAQLRQRVRSGIDSAGSRLTAISISAEKMERLSRNGPAAISEIA
jgi:hypothetical protein